MPRRISTSQIRSSLRQSNQKIRREVSRYNQFARRHNQQVKRVVNKYNQGVRTYNARVRAHQQRIKNELARFNRQSSTISIRHTDYYTSVKTLCESYSRLENHAASQHNNPHYNRVLDLSELEAANGLAVANVVFGDERVDDISIAEVVNTEICDGLQEINPDLDARWKGAVFSLDPDNPDAARHFCASAREIITQIIEIKAPDTEVLTLLPKCEKTDRGNPTRRSKIKYFLHRRGMLEEALETFVADDIENIVRLFQILNDGTHGPAGAFDLPQLNTIKKRVEDGINFLIDTTRDI